jgi:DNA-binding transcriptional MerR regulator
LKQYVLRYWETEFKQLSPSKNKAGNRTYRQKDIDTIHRIKDLLYIQKFTIEGARKMLSNENTPESKSIEEKPQHTGEANVEILIKIRGELKSLLENINS